MKVSMEATMRQNYEGRALRTGDSFEAASESDADDLVCLNLAKRVKRVVRPNPVVTREMSSEKEKVSETDVTPEAASATPSTGRYSRRDVRSSS